MNRPIPTILGLALTASLLTACAGTGGGGSTEDDGATGAAGGGSDEEVTSLTFWSNHPGGSKETEEELIAAYEEETGVSITLVTAGANYEEVANRFNAAQAGSDVPDVVVASDVTWFPMMLNDAITPLDELWESEGVDTSSYVDSLREDYLFEDQHYAVPYARSTPLFYYNKDMWEAAACPTAGRRRGRSSPGGRPTCARPTRVCRLSPSPTAPTTSTGTSRA